MAREFLLTNIERKQGRLNHEDIYDLTFLDVEDLTIYACVVDTSYRNYTRSGWDRIIADPTPYGIYAQLIRTQRRNRDGFQVISADSYPCLLTPVTEREIYQIIDIRKAQLGLV